MDFEMMQEGLDRLVKREEFEETTKNFDNFVRNEEFRNLENDVRDTVK